MTLRTIFVLLCVAFISACGSSGGGGGAGGDAGGGGGGGAGAPSPAGHTGLTWDGSPGVCLSCHEDQARQMYASTHYQWQGEALYMTSGPALQGKISDAVNSYCINILGNWNDCGNCHVGLGARPVLTADPSAEQLRNIDCLICHQRDYKRKKVEGVFVPDTDNMTITLAQAVQTVHRPDRATCLVCHAKAGGGDAVKRGDLALATASTSDIQYDRHMSTTGADLNCQDCHVTQAHRIAGKGSDLRQTDLDVKMECTACHSEKAGPAGHETADVNRHVARVACQSCHIPTYAKDAADTPASEATETHRTWKSTASAVAPYHPTGTRANNLVPRYRFWNRYSENYRIGNVAQLDPATGTYSTSRPEGAVDDTGADNKLYPFKYKTAEQPILDGAGILIALDTSVFFSTAGPDAATRAGLVNMGYSGAETYSWVTTDTFQLLNHQVAPASQALSCASCHGGSARVDLRADLGYGLKAAEATVCSRCHDPEGNPGFNQVHRIHVTEERYGCQNCHGFSRPERALR